MKEERRPKSIASMAEIHTRRQTWGDRLGRGGRASQRQWRGSVKGGGGEACSHGVDEGLGKRALPKGVEGAGDGSDGGAT